MTTPIADQETKPAVIRGLKHRCPACGEGALFAKYLKVNDACSECGQELHHHRADDGPAYITILLVGHIMGFALHILFKYLRDDPLMLALSLSTIAVVMALVMLPRVKGMMIGYQWAKGMYGFKASKV